MTLRELLELMKTVRDAVQTKDWVILFKAFSQIIAMIAKMLEENIVTKTVFPESESEEFDNLRLELMKIKENPESTITASAAINPGTVIIIVDLVLQLIDLWKKRRQA